MQRLKTMLNSIDHKGYPAYKGLKGSYDFGDYRLGIDKVQDQAQRATVNFFTLENLTALREIALRRCADRVNLLTGSGFRFSNKSQISCI